MVNKIDDPSTYDKAFQCSDSDLWKEGIQKEYDSML